MADFTDDLASTFGVHPSRPVRDGYIVVERAYEYNDEYNSLQDGVDIASPVFATLEEASAVAQKKQLSFEFEQDEDNWYDNEIPQLYTVQKIQVIE